MLQVAEFKVVICIVVCGQTVGWIKMPLGVEVGLDPGDMLLAGAERGTAPATFWPMSIVAKWLDRSGYHLVWSRAGLVWIFQIRFDSVRFSISSTGFGFRTSPQ